MQPVDQVWILSRHLPPTQVSDFEMVGSDVTLTMEDVIMLHENAAHHPGVISYWFLAPYNGHQTNASSRCIGVTGAYAATLRMMLCLSQTLASLSMRSSKLRGLVATGRLSWLDEHELHLCHLFVQWFVDICVTSMTFASGSTFVVPGGRREM